MSLHASLSLSDSQLPEALLEKITSFVSQYGSSSLAQGREALTARYRPLARVTTAKTAAATQGNVSALTTAEQAAYLLTRLPCTYAVLKAVLHHAMHIVPELCMSLGSVLDLGGGPGTALWSIADLLPHLQRATILEQESSWIKIGKQLASGSTSPLLRDAVWRQVDLSHGSMPSSTPLNSSLMPDADLVICSYLLGELPPDALLPVIERAWGATCQLLVLVEPGTPAGFERIRLARDALLKRSAHIVAPCPHGNKCPMEGSNWCHFGQKVMRTQLHRRLKGGQLGYEEEKYSYLIVSKQMAATTPTLRLLRPPRKRSGHLHLTLCSASGLTHPIISARTPEVYRLGKQAEWGDPFSEFTLP